MCNTAKAIHESMVRVWIGDAEISGLLDSGAQTSTICQSLCNELGLNAWIKSTMKSIRGVSGDIVKGIGEVYVTLRCEGQQPVSVSLLVIPECRYRMILGVDCLKSMGLLCLDYTSGRLVMVNCKNNYRQRKSSGTRKTLDSCVVSDTQKGDYCSVLANRNLFFPPMSDNMLCLPCPKVAKQCIFEPVMADPALMFAKTLSPCDGMVRCRVVNTSKHCIQVFTGTPLGTLQELPEKRMVDVNLNDILTNDQSSDPISKIDLSKSALSVAGQQKFRKFLKSKHMAFAKHDYDLGRVS